MLKPNTSPTSNNQRSMGDPHSSQTPSNPRARRLVITLGDPAGIGAEVTLKALADPCCAGLNVVLVGDRRWLEATYSQLRRRSDSPLRDPDELEMLDLPLSEPVRPGVPSTAAGAAGFAWLTAAVDLVQRQPGQALVTAPIAKASWHAAGHPYPGQTERLAELTRSPEASMLFTARAPHGQWRLNTLLATTHIPLSAVSQRLNAALVQRKLDALLGFCRRFSDRPHLVVAGLNPHAGEAGSLGGGERQWLGAALAGWPSRHRGAHP